MRTLLFALSLSFVASAGCGGGQSSSQSTQPVPPATQAMPQSSSPTSPLNPDTQSTPATPTPTLPSTPDSPTVPTPPTPPAPPAIPPHGALGQTVAVVCPLICGEGTLCEMPDGSCGEACNPCLCQSQGGTVVRACPN